MRQSGHLPPAHIRVANPVCNLDYIKMMVYNVTIRTRTPVCKMGLRVAPLSRTGWGA